jgi:hypothetical protein
MWLMHNLRPDHWTVSDFRKENKELIKSIAIDFRKFLRDSGYITGKSVSTDGTKIKAYASRDTLSLKQIDKKLANVEKEIERYFALLTENDAIENQQEEMHSTSSELKTQIAELQKQVEDLMSQKRFLQTHGLESFVPADPQAKVMKSKDGFFPAYNVQSTVDNASHLIISCEVTNHPNDYYSLEENINTLKEQLELIPETCLADGGYANEEQIQSLEKEGIKCIVPFADESESKKTQQAKGISFTYDKQADCFRCSYGKTLSLIETNHKKRNYFYSKYQSKECGNCPVRQHCTKSKKGRIIYRRLQGEWLKAYREKSKTKEFQKEFQARKCVVEHPFGTMKYYMGQIPILLRSKAKVQIEIDLYSTAYNLTRIKNITTVPELLQKLAMWNPVLSFSAFLSFWLFLFSKKRMYSPVFCVKTHAFTF